MTDFTLRPFQTDDIPAITAIYRDAVLHGTASYELDPPDETEMGQRFGAMVAQGYPAIIAAGADGEVLGYAYANAFRARPAYRWSVEDSVYVAPAAKGRRIGSRLLERLVHDSEALGFRQMIAVIGGARHAASIRLHERAGFHHIGVFAGSGYKHGHWLDTVLMQRSLGSGANADPDPDAFPGTLYRPKSA